jgi:hypothetical protein
MPAAARTSPFHSTNSMTGPAWKVRVMFRPAARSPRSRLLFGPACSAAVTASSRSSTTVGSVLPNGASTALSAARPWLGTCINDLKPVMADEKEPRFVAFQPEGSTDSRTRLAECQHWRNRPRLVRRGQVIRPTRGVGAREVRRRSAARRPVPIPFAIWPSPRLPQDESLPDPDSPGALEIRRLMVRSLMPVSISWTRSGTAR